MNIELRIFEYEIVEEEGKKYLKDLDTYYVPNLTKGTTISLNKDILNLQDITTQAADFSYSFDFAGDADNSKFFTNFGNLNWVGKKHYLSYKAQIVKDGDVIFNGRFILQKFNQNDKIYTGQLFGHLALLLYNLKDKKVGTLEYFKPLTHKFRNTEDTMRGSWYGQCLRGSVDPNHPNYDPSWTPQDEVNPNLEFFYPVVDTVGFGYYHNENIQSPDKNDANKDYVPWYTPFKYDDVAGNDGIYKGFVSSETSPAVKLLPVIEHIFTEAGFDLDMSYFHISADKDKWINAYIQTPKLKLKEVELAQATASTNLETGYTQEFPLADGVTIDTRELLYDNISGGDVYMPNDSTYVCDLDGDYTIQARVDATIPVPAGVGVTIRLLHTKAAGGIARYTYVTLNESTPSSNPGTVFLNTIDAKVGDTFTTTLEGASDGFHLPTLTLGTSNTMIISETPEFQFPKTIDIGQYFGDLKQLDLVKEFMKLTKSVVVYEEAANEALIRIKPIQELWKDNDDPQLDITGKIDRSELFEVRPATELMPKTIEYKWKEGKDVLNTTYKQDIKQGYGDTINVSTGMVYAGQEFKVSSSIFTAYPTGTVTRIAGKLTELVVFKGFKDVEKFDNATEDFSLFLWEGTIRAFQEVENSVNVATFRIDDIRDGLKFTTYSYYPMCSNYLLTDAGDYKVWGDTQDINWESAVPFGVTSVDLPDRGRNLYDTYHREYIEALYDRTTVIVDTAVQLTPFEFANLHLWSPVMLDNARYRILSYSDYDVLGDKPMKIKLMKDNIGSGSTEVITHYKSIGTGGGLICPIDDTTPSVPIWDLTPNYEDRQFPILFKGDSDSIQYDSDEKIFVNPAKNTVNADNFIINGSSPTACDGTGGGGGGSNILDLVFDDLTDILTLALDGEVDKTTTIDLSSKLDATDALQLGTSSTTAHRGDHGSAAYNHSLTNHAPATAEANVQSDCAQTVITEDDYIKNKPAWLQYISWSNPHIESSKEVEAPNFLITGSSPTACSAGGSGGYVSGMVFNDTTDMLTLTQTLGSQVTVHIPSAIYDDAALWTATNLNTTKITNVDHPIVYKEVPANAVFTDTVYTHPSSHPISMITGLQDELNKKLNNFEDDITVGTIEGDNFIITGSSPTACSAGGSGGYVTGMTFNDTSNVLTLTQTLGGQVTVIIPSDIYDDTAVWTAVDLNTGARHSHSNKTVLDGITSTKVGNWDTAYSWGNHASAGYITGYTETDPIYTSSSWYTTTNNSSNWNTAYGWGDHSGLSYLKADADTRFVNTTGDEIMSGSLEAANFLITGSTPTNCSAGGSGGYVSEMTYSSVSHDLTLTQTLGSNVVVNIPAELYDDAALWTATNLNTSKVGITSTQASAITANTAKVTNVAHPIVSKAVPSNALFTDTIYSKPTSEPISYISGLQTELDGKWGIGNVSTIVDEIKTIKDTFRINVDDEYMDFTNYSSGLRWTASGPIWNQITQIYNYGHIDNPGTNKHLGSTTYPWQYATATEYKITTGAGGTVASLTTDGTNIQSDKPMESDNFIITGSTPTACSAGGSGGYVSGMTYSDTTHDLTLTQTLGTNVIVNIPAEVYDDSALWTATNLNTSKVTNIAHPLVEKAVPSNAVFTDTLRGIDNTPVNGQTSESITSNWAYDHNAGTGVGKHIPTGGVATKYLNGTGVWSTPPNTNTHRGIDNVPVNGQTSESITSNWAYDHNAGTGNGKHLPPAAPTSQYLRGDGVWDVPDYIPNTWRGITNSVSTTSSYTSASATAVKTAYDKGNHSHPYLSSGHNMTLTVSGDASGSTTFTNMASSTLSVIVANDSHTHDGRYYTESESNSKYLRVGGGNSMTADLKMGAKAIIFSGSGTNTDHIWYDDGPNEFHFVADNSYKTEGNADVVAGNFIINGSSPTSCSGVSGNYLPLTGGTLIGPLSGTSASFNDKVQAEAFTTGNGDVKFHRLTQAQYNAIGTKNSDTMYIIVG